MKATLDTYRQSPRKVRLLADLIRGKKVDVALVSLQFADKRAAPIFAKLLKSAIANATSTTSVNALDLFVKEVGVNQGVTMKRIMPRARGTANRINKRTSHIHIVLGVKEPVVEAPKKAKSLKKPKVSKSKAIK